MHAVDTRDLVNTSQPASHGETLIMILWAICAS